MNRFFGGGRFGRGRGMNGPGMLFRISGGTNKDSSTIDQLRSLREQLNAIEKKIKGIRND